MELVQQFFALYIVHIKLNLNRSTLNVKSQYLLEVFHCSKEVKEGKKKEREREKG